MKVPFEEVPELVAGRRVYIHKGHAYVAMHQVSIIMLLVTFWTYEVLDVINIMNIFVSWFPFYVGGFTCSHSVSQ